MSNESYNREYTGIEPVDKAGCFVHNQFEYQSSPSDEVYEPTPKPSGEQGFVPSTLIGPHYSEGMEQRLMRRGDWATGIFSCKQDCYSGCLAACIVPSGARSISRSMVDPASRKVAPMSVGLYVFLFLGLIVVFAAAISNAIHSGFAIAHAADHKHAAVEFVESQAPLLVVLFILQGVLSTLVISSMAKRFAIAETAGISFAKGFFCCCCAMCQIGVHIDYTLGYRIVKRDANEAPPMFVTSPLVGLHYDDKTERDIMASHRYTVDMCACQQGCPAGLYATFCCGKALAVENLARAQVINREYALSPMKVPMFVFMAVVLALVEFNGYISMGFASYVFHEAKGVLSGHTEGLFSAVSIMMLVVFILHGVLMTFVIRSLVRRFKIYESNARICAKGFFCCCCSMAQISTHIDHTLGYQAFTTRREKALLANSESA